MPAQSNGNCFAEEKKFSFKVFSISSIFWFAFTNKDKIITSEDIDAGSMKYFKLLHQDLLERGIYLGPSGYEVGFISTAHSDEILKNAAENICASLEKVFSVLPERVSEI